MCYNDCSVAAIAQSVERIHGKDEVTSSNLVRGSIFIGFYNGRGRGFAREDDGDGAKGVGR